MRSERRVNTQSCERTGLAFALKNPLSGEDVKQVWRKESKKRNPKRKCLRNGLLSWCLQSCQLANVLFQTDLQSCSVFVINANRLLQHSETIRSSRWLAHCKWVKVARKNRSVLERNIASPNVCIVRAQSRKEEILMMSYLTSFERKCQHPYVKVQIIIKHYKSHWDPW